MASHTQYVPEVEWFTNTSEFQSTARHFEEHGRYTLLPKETEEYKVYWKEEDRKCRQGITNSVGIKITGVHYFYLNFVRIKSEDILTGRKKFNFPRFLDIDYDYFHIVEQCRLKGKGLVFTKPRRTGFSYKSSALIAHEYNFYRDSVCVIGAFLEKLSATTMNMVLDNLNFLNANTEWRKQRNPDTKDFVKARFEKSIDGIKIWAGYMSEVKKLTFKDNPSSGVGLTTSIFLFEEGGTLANLRDAYGITEPCWKDGDNMIGLPIIQGTGGSMEKGTADFAYMHSNPREYNLLEFNNIWEEGKELAICGWFIQATRGRLGSYKDELGKHPEWKGKYMVDEDGNSLENIALASILDYREIKRKGGDPKNIQDAITQYPLTPAESFLRSSGAIFSSIELHEWLSRLETVPSLRDNKKKIELYFDIEGKIKSRINPDLIEIDEYPLPKDRDKRGCIVVWEEPPEGLIPYGLFLGGCLIPGEKVITDKGLISVEDITENEKLVNKEGDYVDINKFLKYDKKEEDIYKLKISNTFRTTTFTKEHPIYISKPITNSDKTISENKLSFNFKPANKLEIGDWIKYPNFYNKKNKFDISTLWINKSYRIDRKIENPINKEDFWWFIGLWLGDGWCESNGYKICVAFNKREEQYIQRFIKASKEIFNRPVTIRDRNNGAIEASICFQQLNSFLTNNFGKYSYGKYIPEWGKRIDDIYKRKLIEGYLDSDGCITKSKTGYYSTEFVSINLELLEAIQDISFSIGLVASLNKLRNKSIHIFDKKRCCKTKECYHLRFGHQDTIELCKQLNNYNNLKINKIDFNNLRKLRKRPKDGCFISKCKNYIYFKIREIEKFKYTGIVYNFDCKTHTFICPHITTHNCDPIDQDQASSTDSLGSFFIYKRFLHNGSTYDTIVAEYTGRPNKSEEFYETCRRLCIYYNAKCLYENQLKGFKVYFETKNSLHYLCEQPQIIKDIVKDSKVNRGYGIHMNRGAAGTSGIKDQCEIYLRDWLYQERTGADGEKLMNLHTIKSIPLLKELIAYDRENNCDRIIAFMLCILQAKEMHKLHMIETTPQTLLESESFFRRKLFMKNKYNTIKY